MVSAPRTRMEASERHRQVVEAAVQAFAVGGYAGTTTDQVARIAGVSQPYTIRLFGSKQELFIAAYNHICDQVEDNFRQTARRLTEAEPPVGGAAMAGLGATGYRMLISDPNVVAMMLHGYTAAAADTGIAKVVRERFGRIYRLARELGGASPAEARDFMAAGALVSVLAVLDVLKPGQKEDWAQELIGVYLAENTSGDATRLKEPGTWKSNTSP